MIQGKIMVWVINFRYWRGIKAEMCGMQFPAWPGLEEGCLPSSSGRRCQRASGVALRGLSGEPEANLYRETGKGAEDRAQILSSSGGKPEKSSPKDF